MNIICEHHSVEVVGGLAVCNGCGKVLALTGQVPVSGNDEPVSGNHCCPGSKRCSVCKDSQ